jgi:DNA-binding transcriptional ArsR family regulator
MSRRAATKDVFQAIADPTRRRILDLLSDGEQPVSELASQFDVTLSAISQHLGVLREAGLIVGRQEGRERLYRLNPTALQEVSDWVAHYERFWRGRLAALGEHLKDEDVGEMP